MLAAIVEELVPVVPAWGCVVLAMIGVTYLVCGGWWPRLFDVLSMTVLGCAAGLVACTWVPLPRPMVIVIGGVLVGGVAALGRGVAHAVLAAIVLGVVLAALSALAVGAQGFALYQVVTAADRGYAMQIPGPNLACDPVLAAGLTGLLLGATVAVRWLAFSRHLATCIQGAGLVVLSLAHLLTGLRGERGPALAMTFPLTLAALWLSLVVIGLVVQRALARPREAWEVGDDELAEDEP